MLYAVGRSFGAPLFGPAFTLNSFVFGYFAGMVVSLYFLHKAQSLTKIPMLMKLIIADLLILAIGAFNMSFTVGVKNALYLGVVPFIASGVLKVFAAYTFLNLKNKLRAK